MDRKKLQEVYDFCLEHRIYHYKDKDLEIEIELGPTKEQVKAAEKMAEAVEEANKEVSDEDILFNPYAGMDDKE